MWVVAKIKKNELEKFKSSIKKILDKDIIFYHPAVGIEKKNKNILKKYILGNYIFCFHKKFSKISYLNSLKFIEGLDYFLNGFINSQKEIKSFINHCKKHEDSFGYIKHSFFTCLIKNSAKFISGPFSNMIFRILKKEIHI